MPNTPDKRRRSDLDLFILALIDGGISTPYELQNEAGLSQGATVPALQRLLEAQFVRQGKPGSRGRIKYKVSAAGKRALKDGWLSLVEGGPTGELDADLRIALLALWACGDIRQTADFLHRSADKRAESVSVVGLPQKSHGAIPLAYWYSRLRTEATKAMIAAESNVLNALAAALPRKLTARPSPTRLRSRKLKHP